MPSVMQAAGGCGCVAPGCAVGITGSWLNCDGSGTAGYTVEARDSTSTGTVLGTTTTAAGGAFSFSGLAGTIGHDIVLVFPATGRWATTSFTLHYVAGAPAATNQWSCGFTTASGPHNLVPAAGYTCNGLCALPWANTLHMTYGGFPYTLVYGTDPFSPFTGWYCQAPIPGPFAYFDIISGTAYVTMADVTFAPGTCPFTFTCPPSLSITSTGACLGSTFTITE